MITNYLRQKLIYQIGIIVLVGFVISFVLSLYLLSYDKSQSLNKLSVSRALQRVVSIADTLKQTPDSLHRTLLDASASSDLQLSLTKTPKVAAQNSLSGMENDVIQAFNQAGYPQANITLIATPDAPLMSLDEQNMATMHQRMMGTNSMMDNRASNGHHLMLSPRSFSATINGSVLVAKQWLNFSSGVEKSAAHWSSSVLLTLVCVMLLTVLVSLMIIRRALKPIRQLGNAAQIFAHTKQVQEVNSDNHPQDLTPTINAFNQMQHQVTEYIDERTKLLAAISHDLRTPLTSLRLRAEFLEENEDRQQILNNIETMDKMLSETLRFAKQDAQPETCQRTELYPWFNAICQHYQQQGIEITLRCPNDAVGSIPVINLKRMVENLLNNAAQYAGNDASISLEAVVTSNRLSISVVDTGVGIEPQHHEQALKPFVRLDNARNTQQSNIGLGLAITQSLASKYGGELRLEANQPKGLKATIHLAQ